MDSKGKRTNITGVKIQKRNFRIFKGVGEGVERKQADHIYISQIS